MSCPTTPQILIIIGHSSINPDCGPQGLPEQAAHTRGGKPAKHAAQNRAKHREPQQLQQARRMEHRALKL